MTYKTIEEWIERNPNHVGMLPIEVCRQIWGTKKKEWVGLTDEDIQLIHYQLKTKGMGAYSTKDIYHAIEAKLREKNET
jgi:hypothetical protein